ncbi:MAG: amidohydrolase family protein [Candidatus Thorarchaeota archaeon]
MKKAQDLTTDIHTHLGSTRMTIGQVTKDSLEKEVDILIDRMNAFGVDRAVLTSFESNESNELYRKASEIYPDRLFYACTIPPRPVESARDQVQSYADSGCKAIVLDDGIFHHDDPAAEILVQNAIEHNLAVYFHSDQMTLGTASFIEKESTIYPEGKFVILHMGGLFGFPSLIPLASRHNVWLEISITLIRLVESPLRVFLDALVQDIGVRSLVFGSEHHSEYPDLMAAMNMMDLNIETSRVITKDNACDVLSLDST